MSQRMKGRRPVWSAALLASVAALLFPAPAKAQGATKGVPLGGIGTGCIDLRSDGSFANATLNGNEAAPTGRLDGCFAAVWARVDGKASAWVLQTDNPFGLPCGPAPRFQAAFPRATLSFSGAGFPLSVVLRGFSSIVPQDVRASSLPAVFLEVEVTNANRTPADVSVLFSWEHLAGAAGSILGTGEPFGLPFSGSMVRFSNQEGLIGMRMDPGPIPDVPKERRDALNTRGVYLFAVDARGLNAEVTTGSWRLPEARSLAGQASTTGVPPSWWSEFSAKGTIAGSENAPSGGVGRAACLVSARLSLRPGERRTIPFVFAWRTPRRYLPDGAEYGRDCLRGFEDVADIAATAAECRQCLKALTSEWQERIRLSSLPAWLADRIIADACILASSSLWTRDSGGEDSDAGSAIFGLLCGGIVGDAALRNCAEPLLSAMFPTLEAADMRRALSFAAKDGVLPASLGDLRTSLLQPGPPATAARVASFAAHVARLVRSTGDRALAADAVAGLKPILARFGAPGAAADLSGAVTGAAVHFAAAEIADVAGDPALAAAWRAVGERWQSSLRSALLVTGQPLALDAETVEVLPSNLYKTNLLTPQEQAPLLDAAARMAQKPGGDGWPACALWANAAWLIRESRVAEGLNAARAIEDILVRSGSLGTTPDTPRGDKQGHSAAGALAGPGSWQVLDALAGTRFDVAEERLFVLPSRVANTPEVRLPVFAPTYWATVDRKDGSSGEVVSFQLDRVLPGLGTGRGRTSVLSETPPSAGLDIREVVLPRRQSGGSEVMARRGTAPLAGNAHPDALGRVVFVFDPPVHLVTGQRLEFVFKPKGAR